MARFRFLGMPPNPVIKEMGPVVEIKVGSQKGWVTYMPVPPATQFEPDKDIGYDITDPMSIRYFQTDPKYQEIVP